MRLRTRLSLAFAALAVLPLLLSAPFVARRLRATFDRELERRAESAAALVTASVQRRRTQVAEAVAAAAADKGAEELARALQGPGPLPPPDATRALAEGRGLSVLALLDAAGQVRSSAHFPARAGDVDRGLLLALQAPSGGPLVADVQVAAPEGPRLWPALLSSRPVEGVPGAFLVGGVLLDGALAAALSQESGAEVEVRRGSEVLGSAGVASGRRLWRLVPLGADAAVAVAVGDAASAEAEEALLLALAAVVGAGLLLSVALGVLLARRTTRPLEALTAGARAVAEGKLQTRVEATAPGEVGLLVDAFNHMTAELSATTAALVKAERVAAWEEVARGLAHELKNPLTPLQTALETLVAAQAAGSPRFGDLFQEAAPAMREEVERLKRTVDAFARFARLPPSHPSPMDLGVWAEQALALDAASPAVARETSLGTDLRVLADRDQLAQVLHNLLRNAEEAQSGRAAWVAVRVRGEGPWALLEVEDAGPGVLQEEAEGLFAPGFSRKPGGTGLGLAIARRIATEHGGSLDVVRGGRSGALFRLRLPRLPPDTPGPAGRPPVP
jgi:two-component system, NtrC family, nitrogen regulation sensor histidine kinase NtrY